MKKFGLLSCLLGLFIGFTATVQAEPHPLCGLSAPGSCFFVTKDYGERKKRTGDKFVGNVDTPSHCPDEVGGLKGLKDDSIFTPLYEILKIDTSKGVINSVTNLQLILSMNTTCGGRPCAPINEDISEYPEKEGWKTVTCKMGLFDDGKYGVCTKEAVRRYIEYFKVSNTTNAKEKIETCDVQPQLVITASPPEIKQGEPNTITVNATKGTAYVWDDQSKFTTKTLTSAANDLIIEKVKLTINSKSELIVIGEGVLRTFATVGDQTIYARGGAAKDKTILKAIDGVSAINVISIEDHTKIKDTTSTDLGCKQLLPKYLVGASCDTSDLKGDARDITYWIQKFSGKITTFIATLAVVLIAWNAFGLVMAGGEAEQITTSKKALMWVGIGLLLTVFAYVIVKTAISLSFLQ